MLIERGVKGFMGHIIDCGMYTGIAASVNFSNIANVVFFDSA